MQKSNHNGMDAAQAAPDIQRMSVIGANCIDHAVRCLRERCPDVRVLFEQTDNQGCLHTLGSVIDSILPMMIVVIQFGELDVREYECSIKGIWAATFECFVRSIVERGAIVYVSVLQNQRLATEVWHDKATQFNNTIKTISRRSNAHFIDILSTFWGQTELFDYAGIHLNQLGGDQLVREWGQHINELPQLRSNVPAENI